MKIKGVNLGNWLVLEKWMKPSLFENIDGEDEYDFYELLSYDEAYKRLKEHRDNFIQEKDFKKISEYGCNLVRIPIPYTIFGDVENRIGCIEYLDNAFTWAEKYDLKILVDLHTAPGGQNGFDNSGISGLCTWHHKRENIEQTLNILERIAERYKDSKALFGVQPLNEPVNEFMFKMNMKRYGSTHPDRVSVSSAVSSEVLRSFYTEVYTRLRAILGDDIYIVYHDGFRLSEWNDFMVGPEYKNVWFDTHMYLNFIDALLPNKEIKSYIDFSLNNFAKELEEAEKSHPVLVGEWCLGQHSIGIKECSEEEKRIRYSLISNAQLLAWQNCHGWIFWNYRMDVDEREDWDFRKSIQNGWLNI